MSEIVFSEQQIIYICVGIVIDGVVLLALIFMIYFFRKEYNKVKELEKIKSEKKSSKRNASSSSSGRFLVPEDTKYIEKASSDEYTPTPVVQPSQEQVAEKQAGVAAPDNQGEPIPESQVTPVPESEPVPENDSFVPPAENQTPQTPAAAPSPAPGPSTAPAPAPGPGAENQQVIVVQPGIRIVKRQVKLRISQ
uniref:Uncharacterized protein n=1 Tax=Panagrolaimus sp. JU765 TaxID=591449 RepID=A0AC34Q7A2_9BILA